MIPTHHSASPALDPGQASRRGTLRVALGEYDTGWEDPGASLERASGLVARLAGDGAELVVLPEMSPTGFTMNAEQFAEPLDGASVARLRSVASENGVWLAAGVATREQLPGDDRPRAYNSLLLIDPTAEIVAHYRKQRLFACGGEAGPYAAGREPAIAEVNGVRVALFICYDLRFPELFRAVARDCDLMLLVANWPNARQSHWNMLLPARAIENQAYMIGVNRTGNGPGLAYEGGSAAYTPWGEHVGGDGDIVEVNSRSVAQTRERWPFLADLR